MSILEQTKTIEQVKQELGPIKASQILRNTKVNQIRGCWSDGTGKNFCAVGALMNFFGWSGRGFTTTEHKSVWRLLRTCELSGTEPSRLVQKIAEWNDFGYTFDQIADKLEEMGY